MKRKLGELLIEAGAVTSDDVESALADQSAGEPSRIGDLLLSTGKITPAALARALALQHELPFADLSYVAPEASGLIPLEFQRAHRLVPFRLDREDGSTRVHIALADPTLHEVVDELKSQLKRAVIVHVAAIDDIENVHAALAGESSGEPVVMGEVLEEEVLMSLDPAVTAEISFPEALSAEFRVPAKPGPYEFPGTPAPLTDNFDELTFDEEISVTAEPAAKSVTEEELFGSLDLEGPPEVAPLSMDLADEIGRHDRAPPAQDSLGFSALSAPLGDAARAPPSRPAPLPPDPVELAPERSLTSEPELLLEAEVVIEPGPVPVVKVPSFAIPPDVPVEPRRSPVEPLRRPSAALGRIALKRVAVNREGVQVAVPEAAAPPPVSRPKPAPPPIVEPKNPDLDLPEWMRTPDPALAATPEAGAQLVALLERVESGSIPPGPAVAAVFRLLVERRVLDEAALIVALEKL